MTRKTRILLATLPVVTGCGGGNGGGSATAGTDPITVVAPAPAPAPGPTPTPSAAPVPTPTGFAAQAAALYDVAPDPAACRAGTLKASVKADVLAKLNALRALHNLPAVTYSDVENEDEAASSLMMAVNRQLSHAPPTSWTCYSSAGAGAAGKSNLIGGWGTGLSFASEDDLIAGWMNEAGSAAIGHRRWLLSPFLGKISYGRVSYAGAAGDRVTAASLRVFGFAGGVSVPSGVPGFVAYPFGDYPVRYFRPSDYLSFTAIANATGSFGSNATVSFARATITVTGPAGALPVSDVASDNEGYGTANSVEWRVAGLQSGVTYTVKISGVTGAPQSEYSYAFRIS